MGGKVFLSVILPVYNQIDKIAYSINSLLSDKKTPKNLTLKPSPFDTSDFWTDYNEIHPSENFKRSVITLPETSNELWNYLSSNLKRNIQKEICWDYVWELPSGTS